MSNNKKRFSFFSATALLWLFFSAQQAPAEDLPSLPIPNLEEETPEKSAEKKPEDTKKPEQEPAENSTKDPEKGVLEGSGNWFKNWFADDKKAPNSIKETDEPSEAELDSAIPADAVTEIPPDQNSERKPEEHEPEAAESAEDTPAAAEAPKKIERDTSKFKTQILSPLIYQPNYAPQNSHLPPAIYKRYFQNLLDEAMRTGNVEVSRGLVEKMQNINLQDEAGNTLVMRAVQFGQARILQMLLAMGANPSLGNGSGQSPLHTAISQGDKNIVALLLSYGAAIDQGDGRGQTALMYSVRNLALIDISKLLLEKSADLERQDMYGRTALWEAVANRNLVAAELLMQRGANVDVASDADTTALMAAASLGQIEAAALLLQAGADPNAKDRYGRTAYDIAMQSGMQAVAEMLNSEMARQTLIKDRIDYAKARQLKLKNASASLYRSRRDRKSKIPLPVLRPTQEIAALPIPSFGSVNGQNYFPQPAQSFAPAAPLANPQIMPFPTYGVAKPPAPVPPPLTSLPPPILAEQKSPPVRDTRDDAKLLRAFR
jgi:ankyrin repeat protein